MNFIVYAAAQHTLQLEHNLFFLYENYNTFVNIIDNKTVQNWVKRNNFK